MKTVILTRRESGDDGTFGILTVGDLTLFTGELPDDNNVKDFSCFLPGKLSCAWTYSPAFKRMMYEIRAVGRSGVRIHSANFVGDRRRGKRCQLRGCLALGEKRGVLDGQKALLLSTPAVRRFETYMGKQPFILEVINGYS